MCMFNPELHKCLIVTTATIQTPSTGNGTATIPTAAVSYPSVSQIWPTGVLMLEMLTKVSLSPVCHPCLPRNTFAQFKTVYRWRYGNASITSVNKLGLLSPLLVRLHSVLMMCAWIWRMVLMPTEPSCRSGDVLQEILTRFGTSPQLRRT